VLASNCQILHIGCPKYLNSGVWKEFLRIA